MSKSSIKKGRSGEDTACRFLKNKGFQIVHRNYRLSRFEIDIICRDDDSLVFVEVKNAVSDKFGHPASWVDRRKQERLRLAARMYLNELGLDDQAVRFDVVTVNRGEVEYYKNAF